MLINFMYQRPAVNRKAKKFFNPKHLCAIPKAKSPTKGIIYIQTESPQMTKERKNFFVLLNRQLIPATRTAEKAFPKCQYKFILSSTLKDLRNLFSTPDKALCTMRLRQPVMK